MTGHRDTHRDLKHPYITEEHVDMNKRHNIKKRLLIDEF